MQYPVERTLRLSAGYNVLLWVCCTLAVLIVTLITTAASGYESVVFTSADFNATNPLWYDRFIPASLRSPHRNCTPAQIVLDQCIRLSGRADE
jgi:hypothetical protein